MTMRHLFALIFVCSSLASVVASSTQGRKERRYLRRKLEDPEFQLRIIGGDNADEDRYPYYVALMRKGGSFICGGTLIASDVVLTAAHCFAKDLESVLVGKYARGDSNTDPLEERAIDQTYIHPDFHYDKRRFDQMLITLKSPSTYPYLKHINLDESVPAVGGSDITTIGLGVTSLGGNRPDVLQEVTNNYVPNDKCAKERSNQIDYADVIRFDHLCVEGQNNAGGQCYGRCSLTMSNDVISVSV
jgi:secreted trypsin-like serine protease